MLEGPIRYNVGALCLADLETPEGFLNLNGVS